MADSNPPFRFKWRYLFLCYAVLLLLSFFSIRETDAPVFSISIPEIDAGKPTLLYLWDPIITTEDRIHSLRQQLNVVTVKYPNTSFEVISELIVAELNQQELSNIHVLGEGIGGSVAVHLVSNNEQLFASINLVSANGVDELELLGGYYLNHAIYNARKAFNIFLKYGVPQFGLFPNLDENIHRNTIQSESDQRLIRDLFPGISIPSRVYHLPDAKISTQISEEHHRLLPQSEFLDFENESEFNSEVVEFIIDTENGVAPSRAEVTNMAEQQALKPFDPANGVKAEGRALVLLMLIIILSTLVSEDLTCIGTGLMIARGLIGFGPGVIACLLGIFIGDILLYLAGRWLGSSTLNRAPLKWFITEKDIQLSYHWFEAKGPAIIIASRFIPGSRFPTYFSAGAIGANFITFITFFGIASIIWTPILVGLAVLLGQEMIGYFSIYQDYALWVLLSVLIFLFLIFKLVVPSFTFKGRRQLVGRFKRTVHWEFWSPYILYAPVLLYTVWLWIKYRSITLVTLVNPGFEDGGFVKESKIEILNSIKDKKTVARYQRIEADLSFDERTHVVTSFMKENELDYPIVLKPDVGERGRLVSIVKSESDLRNSLKKGEDFIIQEYISGQEFGVFYYKYPRDNKGQILSITKKNYMALVGDGKHTLEHLILQDSRAVCLAEIHFEQHIEQLFSVPGKGEKIPLVEVGTHARGAIFLDATELVTPELISRMDEIASTIEGFYFGRFDIKVPSEEALKIGKNLAVLEVNGVTSEATHIYDPRYSYFYAVRTLINQWKIAYEIAAEVKEANPELKTPGPMHILSLLN